MKRDLYNTQEVYYQDMFKNYSKEPRDENWQSIENQLREDDLNIRLKAKFHNFAVAPPMENWSEIESKLAGPMPRERYSLGLRIAAGICLIILVIVFNGDENEKIFSDVFQGFSTVDMTEAVDYDLCQQSELIELDIVKIKPVIKKPRKRKVSTSTSQKSLLDIILAVDEDIAATVDSALIADLIKPAKMLSDDGMYASTNRLNILRNEASANSHIFYLPEINYNLEIPADTIVLDFIKAKNP